LTNDVAHGHAWLDSGAVEVREPAVSSRSSRVERARAGGGGAVALEASFEAVRLEADTVSAADVVTFRGRPDRHGVRASGCKSRRCVSYPALR